MPAVASKVVAKNNLPIALVDGTAVAGGHNYASVAALDNIPADCRVFEMVCAVTNSALGTTDFYKLCQDSESTSVSAGVWVLVAEGSTLTNSVAGGIVSMDASLTLYRRSLRNWSRNVQVGVVLTLVDCDVDAATVFSGAGTLVLKGSTVLDPAVNVNLTLGLTVVYDGLRAVELPGGNFITQPGTATGNSIGVGADPSAQISDNHINATGSNNTIALAAVPGSSYLGNSISGVQAGGNSITGGTSGSTVNNNNIDGCKAENNTIINSNGCRISGNLSNDNSITKGLRCHIQDSSGVAVPLDCNNMVFIRCTSAVNTLLVGGLQNRVYINNVQM